MSSSPPAEANFVTVVSVGVDEKVQEQNNQNHSNIDTNSSGYITVLTIGDVEKNDVVEEILVYRLPGERLGLGLKFEGGTKACEFVKRLFIQSSAPESPASRVKSSWGSLVEGDEVLEIDSMPVNSMTRIDCVRCLKDSNVVIKLLVRHFHPVVDSSASDKKKVVEELPLVISTEKKRTPPPPPPVPPRKIPRKLFKRNSFNNEKKEENSVSPAPRQISNEKKKYHQYSNRTASSPDISRKVVVRKLSTGSLGPPEAEVYMDLFSQESTLSLSESDDTGSTISTVVDRFGSFPTTTTSSFAGSLPSTPSAAKRQIDLSNLLNAYIEDDLMFNDNFASVTSKYHDIDKNSNGNEDGNPIQPPSCFQDAPLSYGNENMRIIDEIDACLQVNNKKATNNNNNIKNDITQEEAKLSKKPPVPPRSRDMINNDTKPTAPAIDIIMLKETNSMHDENMNISNLPRLVDFVPKTTKESVIDKNLEVLTLFLENERYENNNDDLDNSFYNSEIDMYSSKWSLSPQLATIGEVEEEGNQEFHYNGPSNQAAPIVIVENADCEPKCQEAKPVKDVDAGTMEIPPSNFRQPPDGHEFPDYVESSSDQKAKNKRDHIAETPTKMYKSVECINLSQPYSSLSKLSNANHSAKPATKETNDDIKCRNSEPSVLTKLHSRSQSLIDMSVLSKQKDEKWNLMIEQRRKGLSKLKGLVIPESVADDVIPAVNIPEIRSHNTTNFLPVSKLDSSYNQTHVRPSNISLSTTKPSLVLPPWSSTSTIPNYSPAFKRKSLQVYATNNDTSDALKLNMSDDAKSMAENFNDPPKSLESITSPTRSECGFDYVNTKNPTSNKQVRDSEQMHKSMKELSKSEDESDNDSALSSSQSSYISRCSLPPSPTNDLENMNSNSRLLKPTSVEAINRKNILASAKCRSGKDFKVKSPTVQRKTEEVVEEKPSANIVEKINTAFNSVDNIAKEIVDIKTEKIKSEIVQPVAEEVKQVPVASPSLKAPIKLATATSKYQPNATKTTHITSKERSTSSYLRSVDAKPLSVNMLKKNFENIGTSRLIVPPKASVTKPPITTRNSVKLEGLKIENKIKNETPPSPKKETNPIVKTSNNTKYESKITKSSSNVERKSVELTIENLGDNLGITLAGGVDENKEITIHRIRYGSVAYKNGCLKRGDKIITINQNSMKELTHAEAVALLKESRLKFTFVIEENNSPISKEDASSSPRRKSTLLVKTSDSKAPNKVANNTISIQKDSGGLGFSIEGGKDSPQGDVPLVIRKLFQGGVAEKCGKLCVGDELLAINDTNFSNLSRIEAWNLMKKIPDGNVTIYIFR